MRDRKQNDAHSLGVTYQIAQTGIQCEIGPFCYVLDK